MKKMPCLFVRDFAINPRNPPLLNVVTNGCEWVLNGEGTATRKFDGTSCAIINKKLYARYDVKINRKTGQRKAVPEGAIPCQPEPDKVTGHWPHWLEVKDQPEFQYHREAWEKAIEPVDIGLYNGKKFVMGLNDGTYELCGPKLQGNPEGLTEHKLIPHGQFIVDDFPRDFEGMKEYLRNVTWEGIVFHHPDGRMCKIRRKDFGFE